MGERSAGNGHSAGGEGRQFVKFSFFKLDNAFRRLPDDRQRAAKLEFVSTIRQFNRRMLLRSYSLVGLRGDTDFMLWQVASSAEPFQELATAIFSTSIGPYLETPYSYLAITRRSIQLNSQQLIVGPLTLDLATRRVLRQKKEIDLTPTEFSLLEFLMRNAGQVVTRKMICEHLWEEDWEGVTNVIEVHVNRLRSKIDRDFSVPLLQTVRGRGYVLRSS